MIRLSALTMAMLLVFLPACSPEVPQQPPPAATTPAADSALSVLDALMPGNGVCLETPPLLSGPPYARPASWSHTWYGNDALWVAPASVPGNRWHAGGDGNKLLWWRGVTGSLAIHGRPLDGPAAPLKAEIPAGYGETGLQVTGLWFSRSGCWEVTATVGEHMLRFVVWVVPGESRAADGAAGGESAASPAAEFDSLFYVRPQGAHGRLVAYDMSTGSRHSAWPAGLLAADRQTYVALQQAGADGGSRLSVYDLPSDRPTAQYDYAGSWLLSGVSPNGRWVALTRASSREAAAARPPAAWQTTIQIIDRRTGAVTHRLDLDGNFEVETVSAAGDALFLIQHLPAVNPDHYLIRLFDLTTETLAPDALRDKQATDEVMAGLAWDGVASPDGRWLLTLYLNTQRNVAFVHTLDLIDKFPVCIDLPSGDGTTAELKAYSLVLSPDRRTLYAANPVLGVVAVIDLLSRGVTRVVAFDGQAPAAGLTAERYAAAGRAALSNDGTTLYFSNGLAVWSYGTGSGTVHRLYESTWRADLGSVVSMTASPNGRELYLARVSQANGDTTRIILDAQDGRVVRTDGLLQGIPIP